MLSQDVSRNMNYGSVSTSNENSIQEQNDNEQQLLTSTWGISPSSTRNTNPTVLISSCSSSSTALDRRLAESNFGANANIFNCYFVPRMMPPRCIACNRLISEHPIGAGEGQTSIRPAITTEGSVDTFIHAGNAVYRWTANILLLIGIVLFIILGVTYTTEFGGSGFRFIPAAMLFFMGVFFSSITKSVTVTFDKSLHQICYHSSYVPWICWDKLESFSFSFVIGVEVRKKMIYLNNILQSEVVLRLRTGNEMELGLTDAVGAPGAGAII
jgi:hypothetical protein